MQQAPSVIFLFGQSGVGKSFVGDVIARYLGWPIYEADNDISVAMQQALDNKQPFTQAMRDEFFVRVVSRIKERLKNHDRLIVTQGLYKQTNRDFLKTQLPELTLVCVQADSQIVTDRLLKRQEGIDIESAKALINDFDPPDENTPIILNNGGQQEIVDQLNDLFVLNKSNDCK